MEDAEALKAVQRAVAAGRVRFDTGHFTGGVHRTTDLTVSEICEVLQSPFASVVKSTTDKRGRLKLEVLGPHAGTEWIVVVIVTADAFVITVYEVQHAQDEKD